MTVSRRSFFGLASLAPFVAPDVVQAVKNYASDLRVRAMLGAPIKFEFADDDVVARLDRLRETADRITEAAYKSNQVTDAASERMRALLASRSDPSVLAQMRDHDIFELGEVAA